MGDPVPPPLGDWCDEFLMSVAFILGLLYFFVFSVTSLTPVKEEHLADEMLAHGYRVRALDNLSFQVHGPDRNKPNYLNPEVELLVGDVRDPEVIKRSLKGIDAVYHFAAEVGVGQSMYEITKYTSTNNLGTAVF